MKRFVKLQDIKIVRHFGFLKKEILLLNFINFARTIIFIKNGRFTLVVISLIHIEGEFMKKWLSVLCTVLVLQGCSGGSSSELDATSVSDVSSTFNALEGLLFDVEDSSSSKFSSTKAQETSGPFSMMGCHYKQDRQRMLNNFNQIRTPLCFIGKVEENIKEFKILDETFSYYEVSGADGEGGSEKAMKLRIAKYTNNGKRCLQFHGCKGDATTPTEYLNVCETDDGVSASSVHSFAYDGTQVDPQNPSNTVPFSGDGTGELTLTAKGSKKDGETEITEFSLVSSHDESGNFGTNTHCHKGFATLTGNKEQMKNTFDGSFEGKFYQTSTNCDDTNYSFYHQNDVCIAAGQGFGSGVFTGANAFPAYDSGGGNYYCPPPPGSTDPAGIYNGTNPICVQEGISFTESFSMAKEGQDNICERVENSQSPWFSSIGSNCEVDYVAPDTATLSSQHWDCTADNFVAINLLDLDVKVIQECIDLDGRYSKNEELSCEEQYKDDREGETQPPT